MKTIDVTPKTAIECNMDAFNFKKAFSKFIDTYMVFVKFTTALYVNPKLQDEEGSTTSS